jgi:hypothetical protein
MPRGLPQKVKDHLEKCRWAAIAAVESYNRPNNHFRTALYVVLIIMAWTALFHAIFHRRGRNPWYRKKPSLGGQKTRYIRVDGEPKHWDLAECLKQYRVPHSLLWVRLLLKRASLIQTVCRSGCLST